MTSLELLGIGLIHNNLERATSILCHQNLSDMERQQAFAYIQEAKLYSECVGASHDSFYPNKRLLEGYEECENKNQPQRCKHASISDWMEHYWAIGHSSCVQVKICLTCDKIIEQHSTLPKIEFYDSSTLQNKI